MEALFSSVVGGDGLRRRVLRALEEALAAGHSRKIDVHIMAFSFTDERIARALKDIATSHANVTIRIIADWGQGSPSAGRRVRDLERSGLPNLLVRYKNDQPYTWHVQSGRLRWSYRASRGLLHHKTLGVLIDGDPWKLVCGSFNWTAKATDSYENLLVVSADEADERDLMRAVECEFEAMWCDGRVTLSPGEARAHYLMILDEYRTDPTKAPTSVMGLGAGQDVTLHVLRDDSTNASADQSRAGSAGGRLAIAFSSRSPHQTMAERGYSPHNRDRRFALHKPSGKIKQVPLTLSVLALDLISRAGKGETLKVAMYALSPRVPEYGALLDAARRGVHIEILLDGVVGVAIQRQLADVVRRDGLPIEARLGSRMMHQKYLVHPETRSVLTGTANLSTDSSVRHSEQRILIRDDAALTQCFLSDFGTIWARLPARTR
jgi:phosphatidylserine/phosphatidylglycerophosphate/cardiolipin synthase-like enzyme